MTFKSHQLQRQRIIISFFILSTRFKFKYGHNICHILKSIKDEEYSKLEKKCLKMSFFFEQERITFLKEESFAGCKIGRQVFLLTEAVMFM